MVGAGLEVQQLVYHAAWQRPILLGCVFSGHVVRPCAVERLISLAAGRTPFNADGTIQKE
jgi:hypothetical protein